MNMNNLIKKLTSRKFLLAIVGTISGLALALGVDGSEIENIIATVGGIVTAASSIIAYINGEAKIDAASAGKENANAEQS